MSTTSHKTQVEAITQILSVHAGITAFMVTSHGAKTVEEFMMQGFVPSATHASQMIDNVEKFGDDLNVKFLQVVSEDYRVLGLIFIMRDGIEPVGIFAQVKEY